MADLPTTPSNNHASKAGRDSPFVGSTPTSKMELSSAQFETFRRAPENSFCTHASAGQRQCTQLYGLTCYAMRRSCTTIYRHWRTGRLGSSYSAQFKLVQKWHTTTPSRAQSLHCKMRLQLEARSLSGLLGPNWDLTSDRVPCTQGKCI